MRLFNDEIKHKQSFRFTSCSWHRVKITGAIEEADCNIHTKDNLFIEAQGWHLGTKGFFFLFCNVSVVNIIYGKMM